MRKFLLTLVVITSAACGGGSSGSGVKNDPISPEPSGNLKLEPAQPGTASDSSVFGNSCQTDKLNPQIKPGTTQGVLFNMFAQDTGPISLSGTYTIKSVDQEKQTFVSGMSYGNSSEEETCKLTNEGTLCEGNSPTPSSTDLGGDQSCEVRNGSPSTSSDSQGTLTLKGDGKTISIKEAKMTSTGNLFCNGKDTGKTATQKITFITSPDLPSLISARGFGCNDLVFMYIQVIESTGVVRSTNKMEIVSQSTP